MVNFGTGLNDIIDLVCMAAMFYGINSTEPAGLILVEDGRSIMAYERANFKLLATEITYTIVKE